MGDSACLVQDYPSHASDTTAGDRERNPVFEESVSFGRFFSESLAWEKWSSFSHNKYLDEVEKYSKPGSVAQKKAYFEAHYKRIAAQKAAALLEQSDSAVNNVTGQENEERDYNATRPDLEKQLADPNSSVLVNIPDKIEMPSAENFVSDGTNGSCLDEKMEDMQSEVVEEAELLIKNRTVIQAPVQIESLRQLVDVENLNAVNGTVNTVIEMPHCTTKSTEKSPLRESLISNQEKSVVKEKKSSSFISKISVPYRPSKPRPSPSKPSSATHQRKDNSATPNTKKSTATRDSVEKKTSTQRSLHMSLNLLSHRAHGISSPVTNRKASPCLEKIQVSKLTSGSSKTNTDSANILKPKTSNSVSTNGALKLLPVTPQSENKRTKTPCGHTTPGSRISDKKWQSLSVDRSKSSSASGRNAFSPTVSVSFNFRSEERAAKRKEYYLKLEERFNAKEARKEKSGSEPKKLSQSLGFKAKPMPNFYRETGPPRNLIKTPVTKPRSPKLGRKPNPITVQDTSSSLPPPRPPVKNDATKNGREKNTQTPTRIVSSVRSKKTHENTSPNIQ